MNQSQHSNTRTADRRSLVNRIFGVGFRRDTYKNLAYLLARFPLGILYFSVFVSGLSVGTGLIPVVVGIPILAGVVALAGYVGVVEAELLSRIYGQSLSYDVPDYAELPITEYLKAVITNPRNYLLILFALASFFVGLQLFVAIIVLFALGLAFITTPLFYWMPGTNYQFTQMTGVVDIGPVAINADTFGGSINTLPEALVVSMIGIAVCIVGFHAVNLTAWVISSITERLLGATAE